MSRKNKIIVSIVGITIVLLALLGLTYAYYLTRIQGNTNANSISITTADLKLEYSEGEDSNISLTGLMPGQDIPVKTFTVTNSGNSKVDDYVVAIIDVINTLSRTGDLTYTLTCEEYNADDEKVGDCNGVSNELNSEYGPSYPTHPTAIVLNSIEEGYRHEYSLKLNYVNLTNVDQSDDMGSTIAGKVQIYGNTDTIEMTGTVTGASEGDYVQINSKQMTSEIVDGKYKLVGVEPGVHSVKIMNASGVKQSEQYIKINKGQTASFETGDIKLSESVTVTGPVITMTESTGTATVNLVETIVDEESTLTGTATSIENYNPFNTGTLAYKILNNAYSVTETQEKTNGYAVYRRNPLTKPAVEINNSDEASLSVTNDNYGPSYYFRGNVKNNYVTFNNMCWRIVRIDGNGNIKLILASINGPCSESNLSDTSAFIGKSVDTYGPASNFIMSSFYNESNFSLNSEYYSCLTEMTEEECAIYKTDLFSITPIFNITNKLEKIIIDSDDNYYDLNGNITTECGTVYDEEEDDYINYGNCMKLPYLRLRNDNSLKPTLTWNNYSYVNRYDGYLSYITSNELAYAGMTLYNDNQNNYLVSNAKEKWRLNEEATTNIMDSLMELFVSTSGKIDLEELDGNIVTSHVRPVILLKNTSNVTGNGTIGSPYVIE